MAIWSLVAALTMPVASVFEMPKSKPAALCLLGEMMTRGGAFLAWSGEGSLVMCKAKPNASWPNCSQGVLNKQKVIIKQKFEKDQMTERSKQYKGVYKWKRHTDTPLTWHIIVECGVSRWIVSLQCTWHQHLTERYHDWVVVIMVSKDHPNPCSVAWIKGEIQLSIFRDTNSHTIRQGIAVT